MAENSTDDSDMDALAELNRNFKKSKVMQILRFLHDQDMLNKRFSEIDMENEQDAELSGTASDSECQLTPQQRLDKLNEANTMVDSEDSDASSQGLRHRRLQASAVDTRLELDNDEGAWAVATPKTSPVPPTTPRGKTRPRFRSKTDGEKTKRVLKKLNVRPASAMGNHNTRSYTESLRQNFVNSKPKSSPMGGQSRRIEFDRSQIIWESNYSESDFVGASNFRTSGPSSLASQKPKVNIVPVRGNQMVTDSLLRGGSGVGSSARSYSTSFQSTRERPLRFSTDQFEIHEIGTIRDGADVKTLRKAKCLTEIPEPPVTAIAMVKLPPLDVGKLTTGSNLVNTC